jgi:hypothetical protein
MHKDKIVIVTAVLALLTTIIKFGLAVVALISVLPSF